MTDNMKHNLGSQIGPQDFHKCAPDCDDQIPAISRFGRGPQGDSSYLEVVSAAGASKIDTHLRHIIVDGITGEPSEDWFSDNINGGELTWHYNLNPHSIPRTFTITFIYTRGHEGDKNYVNWSWTTPAIPYIWRLDNEDGSVSEKPDHIVGTGVATLFVRASKNEPWNIPAHERLIYPFDTRYTDGRRHDRSEFNAPNPNAPWSATITFGFDGDVKIPNFDDLAKIIGISKDKIFEILNGNKVTINGVQNVSNLIDYIDKQDDNHLKEALDHLHADLGFNQTGHEGPGAFDGQDTVKLYIDSKISDLQAKLDKANNQVANLYGILDDLLSHVYGASLESNSTGQAAPSGFDATKKYKITWPQSGPTKIPLANINVLSDTTAHAILSHTGDSTGDLKGK